MKSHKSVTKLQQEITKPESPIRAMVCKKASQLRRNARLRIFDKEDVEQILWKCLFRALPKYRVSQGTLAAFACTVLESSLANFLRHHAALGRCCENNVSLERIAENAIVHPPKPNQTTRERQFDVEQVLQELPDKLAQICRHLMTDNKSQAARELGMSRSTMIDCFPEIRVIFRKARLHDYL